MCKQKGQEGAKAWDCSTPGLSVFIFHFPASYGIISPMKTLVILAGGKSTRMGKDKIFLHLHDNETFLEKLYREAGKHFEEVVISAGSNAHAKEIQKLLPEAKVIPDILEEMGPMGGIVSVYEQTGIGKFAAVPADVPGADMEVLSFFYENCHEDACVLKNGEDMDPLIAAYGTHTLEKMKDLLSEKNLRIRAAFSDQTQYYSFADLSKQINGKSAEELEKAFCNINTEQDYRDLIQ